MFVVTTKVHCVLSPAPSSCCLLSPSRSLRQVYLVSSSFSDIDVPRQGQSSKLAFGFLKMWQAIPEDLSAVELYIILLSSLHNLYFYLDLVCCLTAVLVGNSVHPLYSQTSLQTLINTCLDTSQRGLVYSPCFFLSLQKHGQFVRRILVDLGCLS